MSFPAERASAKLARDFVTRVLGRWGVTDRSDELVLCCSELATNALAHGCPSGGEFLVCVEHRSTGRHVRIEVHDSEEAPPPDATPHSPLSEQGRGLLLVDLVSDRWGVEPQTGGKIVWAEFHFRPTTAKEAVQC
ncbi:ATP-binding protein [Streptomyces sp. NPDC059009]|uniref:ATP-binding protein n=1 Tax=Streptomyces sp. NPDC059009 TaxID=3346694 RepID=UPI0036ADCB42